MVTSIFTRWGGGGEVLAVLKGGTTSLGVVLRQVLEGLAMMNGRGGAKDFTPS